MGRIKTALIKRMGKEIFAKHGASVSKDFNENKALLAQFDFKSKKIRNIVAGSLTRLKKREIVV